VPVVAMLYAVSNSFGNAIIKKLIAEIAQVVPSNEHRRQR
jgi:hypothetical protein